MREGLMWTVLAPARPRRVIKLLKEDGALKADVFVAGTHIIFR